MSSIGPGPKRPLNAGMDGSGLTRDNLPVVVEFLLLGSLEAVENGNTIPLGGRQQRALLVALLLRPNEAVPADQLIDALWGERPPPTASTIVQLYISRLRKLLGRDRLLTRPGRLRARGRSLSDRRGPLRGAPRGCGRDRRGSADRRHSPRGARAVERPGARRLRLRRVRRRRERAPRGSAARRARGPHRRRPRARP